MVSSESGMRQSANGAPLRPCCASCAGPVPEGGRSRYCSSACRQRAYRLRTKQSRASEIAGNLAEFPDSFVGRHDELAELGRLLFASRLVTVIGPAGAGKTRLVREVAARQQRDGHRYPDGVWQADLAVIPKGDLVVPAIARAVGIRTGSGLAPEKLAEAMGERKLLLVLDNCEHVLSRCADAVEALLTVCPSVRILATSREALRVRGEQSFPLGELALPANGEVHTAAQVGHSDAVRLFVDRARAVDPAFELTDGNASTVAALCRRLDGMPLAIELAARRVRLLGPADLLRRLDGKLDVLSVGTRTTTSRHDSLEAAIGWDYELLSPGEQELWRRLSVLAGPFPIELAEAVSGHGAETLDLVASLEAKSLLVPVAKGDSVWFRQLESIRIYGRDRLNDAGERDTTHDRLAEWLAELVEPHLGRYMMPVPVLEAIDAHWPNLVAAVEWMSSRRDERHGALAFALGKHWLRHGINLGDTYRMLRAALTMATSAASTGLVLSALSTTTSVLGDQAESLGYAWRAVDIERALDRPARLAKALDDLGHALFCSGEYRAARPSYLESLRILRGLGDPVALLGSLNNIAWVSLNWGEEELAEKLLAEALPLAQYLGSGNMVIALLHTSGVLSLIRGDLAGAAEKFAESLTMGRENPYHLVHGLEGLGIVATELGDDERAIRLIHGAAAVRRQVRTTGEPVWAERVDAAAAIAAGRLGTREAAASAAGQRMTLTCLADYGLNGVVPPTTVVLSTREHTIAALVADGMTNERIARRLRVSRRTVATYLERIRGKLDVRSRAEVAAWIAREENAE
ncbi:LuxR C-terminal-related transcriptional regulator [Amycolatopsis sp. cg5]|uniref:ATP-binding protein n=1 Tax=Amycolatopsis sp. cg5 TaxID=3238802 RepID=UPI0035255EEC